jgi:hypothetical protein
VSILENEKILMSQSININQEITQKNGQICQICRKDMPFNGAFDEYDELLDYTLINAGQLEYSRESDQIEMERVSDPF